MLTVANCWALYELKRERDGRSLATDRGRARHLLRHLGDRDVTSLAQADVDAYREKRWREPTVRGRPPSWATLDREVELLKRVLSQAVACGELEENPLAGVALLDMPNARRQMLEPPEFELLLGNVDERFRPFLVMAYDTGCRRKELLSLRWDAVDLEDGSASLVDPRTSGVRKVYLTDRCRDVLAALPRSPCGHVFVNPRTGKPLRDVRKAFQRAALCIGRTNLWLGDLRRSFVERAREAGISEEVVMRMSGHRTRSVFRRYGIARNGEADLAAQAMNAVMEAAGARVRKG